MNTCKKTNLHFVKKSIYTYTPRLQTQHTSVNKVSARRGNKSAPFFSPESTVINAERGEGGEAKKKMTESSEKISAAAEEERSNTLLRRLKE